MNCYRILTFTIVFVSICLVQAANATITISQEVDRTEMAFEDTATFRIIVSWPGPAHAYLFERPIRLQSDMLKVARFSSTISTEGTGPDEITTKVFRYRLVPVLSGPAEVQSATVEYLSWPDSTSGQLSSDPFVITVAEPLPYEEEDRFEFSGGLVALIAVALLGAGVGLYAAFKPKPVKEKRKSPREAFLDGLSRVKTNAGSDLKQFQTGLYQLLAEYLKARYEIEAIGRPAAGVVAELEKAEPISTVSDTLSAWLVRAEREKFTPLASAPGEVMRLESEVRTFFEKMK